MSYKFTKRARQQLDEITYYISLDNESAAERVYDSILATCQTIADMPSIGRNPNYIADSSIRCINVKKYSDYIIFYRAQRKEIIILWVFHGARDIPALLTHKDP